MITVRTLNKKQKKLIDKWFDENWQGVNNISPNDIPIELWNKLEKMNDHETLYQNVNRYILDKGFEKINRG